MSDNEIRPEGSPSPPEIVSEGTVVVNREARLVVEAYDVWDRASEDSDPEGQENATEDLHERVTRLRAALSLDTGEGSSPARTNEEAADAGK